MFYMKKIILPETNEIVTTGWLPPLPGMRDFTENEPGISKIAKKIFQGDRIGRTFPDQKNLKKWCSPVENQGAIGSCTAQAAVGIVEYCEKRAHNKHIDGSRLFVYKTTRNLMKVTGDTGAWLKKAMAAVALCGVPPEKYWPYTDDTSKFDKEPSSFVYAVADNYEAVRYFCHDPLSANTTSDNLLKSVKNYIAAGIPSMFGFYGFNSFADSDIKGGIPVPGSDENAEWGHAVVAVGYDDNKKITNTKYNQQSTGALFIRNSWGSGWGDDGYGWLPYEYVIKRLAIDFWSILKMDWVDTKNFGL